MKNRLFQRLSAFAVAGAMAVSFAAVPVAATELPEHTHNWVSQVTTVATCQSAGSVAYKCDCGAVETKELPQKTEHTYNAEGKCSVCGAVKPELLTVADPNANNAEGTQTGGNGEQGKIDGGEDQSTESKGDTQNTDGKGETTDGAQNTDGKGETTDGAQNTDGKGETTDGAQNTDGKGETTDGAQNTDGKGETTDGAQNTDGKGETTDGAQNTDGKGETTDGAQNTDGKGETTDGAQNTDGKGETTDGAQNTDGKDETTETSKPTEGKDETTETSKPTEGKDETTEGLTEEEQAAQESAKRVAEVQALIDALRTEVPEEELEAEKAKFDAVTAALATLTEEEKAKLNLTNYQALEELLALLPATLEEKAGPTEVSNETELQDAIAQGGEVVLANDIALESQLVIGDGKEVTLNLNGNTISNKNDNIRYLIKVGNTAKTTICKGRILNTYSDVGVCLWTKAHTNLFLSELVLETTGAQKNQPLTVSTPETTGSGVNVTMDYCTIKGGNICNSVAIVTPATIAMKNSTIVGGDKVYALYAGAKISATIEKSTIDGWTALYMRAASKDSEIEVIDSSLKGTNVHSGESDAFGTIMVEAPVKIAVKGNSSITAAASGTAPQYAVNVFDGQATGTAAYRGEGLTVAADESVTLGLSGKDNAKLLNPDLDVTKATIKIPSKHASMLDADLKLDANNRVVQKINSEERLRAAVAAGGTVTVDADIELSQPLVIANGKEVTLDLNGKTLSDKSGSFGGEGQPDALIIVDNGGSLTVTGNGTIRSSVNGIKMTQDSTKNDQLTAKLVVENGTIEAGNYYAIAGNGSRHNTDITISGGTISGNAGGIFHPQDGTLTITGGTITGGEFGVEMRAGNLKITGGSINAPLDKFDVKPNGSGSTSIGVAVAVVPHDTNKNVTVNISGGTLTGHHALNEAKVEANSGTVSMAVSDGTFNGTVASENVREFISGGTFKEQPKEELAKDHFSFKPNGDNTFGLKEDPYIIDGEGHKDYIDPTNPDAPVSLDKMLENNAQKNDPKITLGANGVVNDAHTMSGKLTMEVNGHKITGSGSISGKLTLKDLYAEGTRLALPQGGKVTFQNGSVQVSVGDMAGPDKSFGYSKPIQITYGGHDYTYFLAIGGSNDGKLSIDANGKPIVSGQHYVVKAKKEKIEKFTMTGIYNGSVTSNDFYKNTNATLQFVTDAPATALEVGFVTVDGKQITDSSCFSVTSGDTAAVTLSNKYLRSLSIGVHTLQMHFKDGKTVYGIFSVRTTSNADSSNPKTGDTIFLPIAVMTLSLTALAVLMPRKKKFF